MAFTFAEGVAVLTAKADGFFAGINKAQVGMKDTEAKIGGSLKKVEANFTKMGGTVKNIMGGLAGYFSFRAILRGISNVTQAAGAQEAVEEKLHAMLKNVIGARKEDADMLIKQAAALQKLTGVGDEEIINAQAMLGTFQLNGDIISRLTPRILDMSAAMAKTGDISMDLQGGVMALGKAYSSGLGMLSRYGVVISEADKKLFEHADTVGKTDILIRNLDANFKGATETMGTTYLGQLKKLNSEWGDMKEKLGNAIIPIITDSFIPAMREAMPLIEKFAGWIKTAFDFWRTSEEEAVQKRIDSIKGQIKNYANFPTMGGMSEAQLKNRQKLLDSLRDEEALLRVIRGETKKNTDATLVLNDAHVKLWESLQNHKDEITEVLVPDPNEAQKALAEIESEYESFWDLQVKLGIISTDKFISNMEQQRGYLVIAFGEYSKEVMAWDLKILNNKKKLNDEMLRDIDKTLKKERILHDAHVQKYLEDEERKKQKYGSVTTSMTSIFREYLETQNEDWLEFRSIWDAAQQDFRNIAVSSFDRIGSAFGDLIVMGGKWKDTFKRVAQSIISDIMRIIIQMLILKAIKIATTGPFGSFFSSGGIVNGFSSGGIVKGQHGFVTTGNEKRDVIPALLKSQEVVLPLPYIKDFFGNAAGALFSGSRMPTLSPATSSGNNNIIHITVNNPWNFDDFMKQVKKNKKVIVSEVNKGRYGYGL